MDKAQIE